eukprot:snap_masked-scaffold241_size241811-processed-gene-0.2 protein:Tk11750 transcript:snap_masked-scaffold241_size241811-processed-gene-0.2-mRNA-1 annotation:"ring canal kelch homolog"
MEHLILGEDWVAEVPLDNLPEDQRPAGPRPQPLLQLRRASISSLDESSQKYDSPTGGGSPAGGGSPRPHTQLAAHLPRLLAGLDRLRQAGWLTDVVLEAGPVRVPAHKSVLAACSPYFMAMFTTFHERDQARVTLNEVEPEALRALVDYAYTAQVQISEDNVQNLLTAANLLQLEDVREACCDFLQAQLHPCNCLGIQAFADLHGCLDLLASAQVFIDSHFTEVLDSDEFLQLRPEQVVSLIASDTITVPSEERVYESVLAWIQHDLEARRMHIAELMSHVRLPLLSKEYLIQRVKEETLLESHPKCKDYIIEALTYHLMTTSAVSSRRVRPRQPIGLPKIMLAIGGQAPKAIRSVECYEFKEERWFPITEMDTRRCRCGVAVVRGRVYAVGGFNGSLRVRTVDEYDPVKERWSSVATMEARRSTLGVAVLHDRIYAVGGFDGSTGLSSAEVLDLSVPTAGAIEGVGPSPSREWRPIASMSTRRSSVGVGVLGRLIYAVGGYDGNSRHCLSSVECYNPELDEWTPVADMSARRSGAGVGVLNGLLFSIGGHDGPLVRKSVECYSPEKNAWTPVAEMSFCRRNAGVVAHNGLLFVVGGDDGSSNLQSVEAYNPKTDTWTILSSAMSIGRSYTGVCVIEKPETI